MRLNRERQTSASHPVKVGDTLTISLEREVKVLRVVAVGERRGPASEARHLYADLSTPPEPRLAGADGAAETRDPGAGRPTKRDRRAIEAFRRENFSDPDK